MKLIYITPTVHITCGKSICSGYADNANLDIISVTSSLHQLVPHSPDPCGNWHVKWPQQARPLTDRNRKSLLPCIVHKAFIHDPVRLFRNKLKYILQCKFFSAPNHKISIKYCYKKYIQFFNTFKQKGISKRVYLSQERLLKYVRHIGFT